MSQDTPFSSYRYYFTEDGFTRELIDGQQYISDDHQNENNAKRAKTAKKSEKKKPKKDKPKQEKQTINIKKRYQSLYEASFSAPAPGLDATGRFLLQVGTDFIEDLSKDPDAELMREDLVVELSDDRIDALLRSVPFALGSEYVNEDWLREAYRELNLVYSSEIMDYDGTVNYYLAEKSQNLSTSERLFFHLVENPNDDGQPFAFVTTYGTKTEEGKIRHMPLSYALTEYEHSNDKLIELLSCLERVSEVCPLIDGFVRSGELFHPLRLSSDEAYQFLTAVEDIENLGIVCRIPNWWKRGGASVSVTVKLGDTKPDYMGFDTILGMVPSFSVDGVPLSESEVRKLLTEVEGLAFLKGKWVSVNHSRLKRLLEQMDEYKGDLTLLDALRSDIMQPVDDDPDLDLPIITNGQWLSKMMNGIRQPSSLRKTKPPTTLKATLRPYQSDGYEWLRNMDKLGFGACLADDMGLGKTVQVLAYLENMRKQNKDAKVLLIVPASLVGNWVKEAEKFTPSMPITVYHGRGGAAMDEEMDTDGLTFLSITTYGMAVRMKGFEKRTWDCLILDEAQAIKNPLTKQTKHIKHIQSRMKIAMTGTPIENDLTNLWSLFDFLDRGLLGPSKDFDLFAKSLNSHPQGYAKLKNMIAPFMLRRVKTDKSIISDLPDKIENIDYVSPAKKQVALYRKYVENAAQRISEAEGIDRRGIILAALTKLKQICNHPDQYLGQEVYDAKESGKFEMLREICETIAEKRERVIVFTQFKEIIPHLDDFLAGVFGRRGRTLHGGTPVKQRTRIVEEFQGEEYIPYIVISVKAGGTGLTLTKANHVIHFDRWWNPAVENQATDRAFRIGQTKKVIVHKLVCKGTIEEKIDAMITTKIELADSVIGSSSGENWITEMNDDELINLLRLEA